MISAALAPPRRLDAFAVASEPGSERLALARAAERVASLGLPAARLERLKTAAAEVTMNAIEHGNRNRPEAPVDVEVSQRADEIIVAVSDRGGGTQADLGRLGEPDLAKKLDGSQSPRGWGLFLVRTMVDAIDITGDGRRRTIWLTMRTGGSAAQGADRDEHVYGTASDGAVSEGACHGRHR
jgi:anti-sigma regulatory factor (Ser/Thr protein kinase)